MKKWEWRHRDWLWVLAFLLFIIGSLYADHSDVMNLISYGSTFVSIALAFVAIHISVREATKSEDTNRDMNIILGELKEKLGQVDNKMNHIDIVSINSKISEGIDTKFLEFSSNFLNKIQDDSISNDELMHIMQKNLDEVKNSLLNNINIELIKEQEKLTKNKSYGSKGKIVSTSIGEDQLKELASGISVGDSYPFFLEDDNQLCMIVKVSDEQLKRIQGNKKLFVSPFYVPEHEILTITIEESPGEPNTVIGKIKNSEKAKKFLQKALPKGIEFYFVTENVANHSIKRLLTSDMGKLALERELNKM